MIEQTHNHGAGFSLKPDQRKTKDEECSSENQFTEHHESSFCRFKEVLKSYVEPSDAYVVDTLAEKLKDASEAVHVDLEAVYKYIAQHHFEVSGRELLTQHQNVVLKNHPMVKSHNISLWREASNNQKKVITN